jgi:hypothetical protein
MRRIGEVRIFVLIIPKVIRMHFGEWKVVVLVCRPRREMKILLLIGCDNFDVIHTAINRKSYLLGAFLSLLYGTTLGATTRKDIKCFIQKGGKGRVFRLWKAPS